MLNGGYTGVAGIQRNPGAGRWPGTLCWTQAIPIPAIPPGGRPGLHAVLRFQVTVSHQEVCLFSAPAVAVPHAISKTDRAARCAIWKFQFSAGLRG